jgi:lipoteichoic acid synthase
MGKWVNGDKLKNSNKYILLYYSFLIILFKSIVLVGFIQGNITSFQVLPLSVYLKILPVHCCFIILLLSFSFLFCGRLSMFFLVSINCLVSAIFLIDLWYYRAFDDLFSVTLIKAVSNLENLSDSIFAMFYTADLLFIIDLPFLFLLVFLTIDQYAKMKKRLSVFAFLFLISVAPLAYANEEIFKLRSTPESNFTILSPIGYHLFDIYLCCQSFKNAHLSYNQKEEIKQWFHANKEILPDNKYKSIFKGKNIICIQFESLEQVLINKKINGQEITPNINRIIKNSLYFSNIYDQVNLGMSADAEFMVNTSVYPIRRGITNFQYPYNTYNSLPKLLRKINYSTMDIHPDKGSLWNWMKSLSAIGFEKCLDSSSFIHDENIGLGLSDGSFFRQIAGSITILKKPFFLFLITMTSHMPWNIPTAYRELILDKNLDQTMLGGYFQSIHYTDKQVGIFLSNLEQSGVLDNTVVVIYGDHCGIHKKNSIGILWFLVKPIIKDSENWWWEVDQRIPLIIYQKNLAGEEVKTIGGHIDILPTLAYVIGIDEQRYSNTAMGRNLLKTENNFAVLSDKKYVGAVTCANIIKHAVHGLDIADLIIKNNYFEKNP